MKDPAYVEARDKLIPDAEIIANQASGPRPFDDKEREAWSATWNRVFHHTMNILAVRAGLVVGP